MAKRYGQVIVFKEGINELQATKALELIAPLLDLPSPEMVAEFNIPAVHSFDDLKGTAGPVWYIP